MSFFRLKDSEGVGKMAMVVYECGTPPINVLFIFLICRRLLFRLISIPFSTEAEFVNV
jgi:hypothetical protein